MRLRQGEKQVIAVDDRDVVGGLAPPILFWLPMEEPMKIELCEGHLEELGEGSSKAILRKDLDEKTP